MNGALLAIRQVSTLVGVHRGLTPCSIPETGSNGPKAITSTCSVKNGAIVISPRPRLVTDRRAPVALVVAAQTFTKDVSQLSCCAGSPWLANAAGDALQGLGEGKRVAREFMFFGDPTGASDVPYMV